MSQEDHPDKAANLQVTADLVWPAIVLSEDRMAAINRRLEYILAASLAIGPAVLITAEDKPLLCAWPILGASFLALAVITSIVARSFGGVRDFSLIETAKGSQQGKDTFALQLIANGQGCIESNSTISERKSWAALAATIILIVALFILTLWLAIN